MILTDRDVVQPDLVVVANPAQISNRGIEGAPLLVVEILSPSTRTQDRTTKAERYASLGVRHYWTVDPEQRCLECYQAREGAYRLVAQCGAEGGLRHPEWPDLVIDLT